MRTRIASDDDNLAWGLMQYAPPWLTWYSVFTMSKASKFIVASNLETAEAWIYEAAIRRCFRLAQISNSMASCKRLRKYSPDISVRRASDGTSLEYRLGFDEHVLARRKDGSIGHEKIFDNDRIRN